MMFFRTAGYGWGRGSLTLQETDKQQRHIEIRSVLDRGKKVIDRLLAHQGIGVAKRHLVLHRNPAVRNPMIS